MNEKHQEIIDKVRSLSAEKINEVLEFIRSIEQRERKRDWIEFDEWALNLAKEKGFDHLSEEDVATIVRQHRVGE